jgi:hypothetical protein
MPIGAEQTATGYEVAWKVAGVDQYSICTTDANGNFGSTIVDHVAGTNTTLESQETFFQQDLNGDSRIGVVTVVEQSGSTKLDLFANAYFFDPAGGTGPSLKYNGLPVFPGRLAPSRQSAQRRRRAVMKSPGKSVALINIQSGLPTPTATTPPLSSTTLPGRIRRWSHRSPSFSRI